MSYTQWDKGFLEGYATGHKAGIQTVRDALLDIRHYRHEVPLEYFELLNELGGEE